MLNRNSTIYNFINLIDMDIEKKFAFIPRIVYTWRRSNSRAIIWMQHYYIKPNKIYCLKLGTFSYEF